MERLKLNSESVKKVATRVARPLSVALIAAFPLLLSPQPVIAEECIVPAAPWDLKVFIAPSFDGRTGYPTNPPLKLIELDWQADPWATRFNVRLYNHDTGELNVIDDVRSSPQRRLGVIGVPAGNYVFWTDAGTDCNGVFSAPTGLEFIVP